MRLFLFLLLTAHSVFAEPILDSWLTDLSGRYARIYPNTEAQINQANMNTWSRGAGTQSQPTYAGIHEVATDANNVYLRATGLAFHIMGPWHKQDGSLFADYPSNSRTHFRITRNATIPPVGSKESTGNGTISLFVDGVSMFGTQDTFSYDTSAGRDERPATTQPGVSGDAIWNRNAYLTQRETFDPALAHQADNLYHYHVNPPGLRHLLEDSVAYDPVTNTYTEDPNGEHSPILGWVGDGLPLYGPYGYSDPTDATSPIRRMISGFQIRDGSNSSTNLNTLSGTDSSGRQTGRTTLPQWIARNEGTSTTLSPDSFGPAVDTVIDDETYRLGHYLQDYAYKGDLVGFDLYEGVSNDGVYDPATDFDLNEYNVRFCVTPEFPTGTWAYFTNIDAAGNPVFPYNLSRYYFGSYNAGDVDTLTSNPEIRWEGGPEKELTIDSLATTASTDDVAIVWNSVEGGHYTIERSGTLLPEDWALLDEVRGIDATTPIIDNGRRTTEREHFYRVGLDFIEAFDDTGFVYDDSIISNGIQNNVLLLILDDWGIDSSELYNIEPGTLLARMPNLKNLLFSDPNATPADTPDKGLLFTRGYAQPICSPTRATLLTGRQPHQHRVGNPTSNNTLPASELTFPEIISAESPDYGLASFGKWHLGSGETGPLDTGGWPHFSGTLGGGVPSYNSWTRVEIENGILTDPGTTVTTYATSAQVAEATSFIASQGDEPWVVWMGFNAPHSPFHDPAPFVTPADGYSTNGTSNRDLYVRMLEALDHEIGNLLQAVDLDRTNIIVVGDNGSPTQVSQAPVQGIVEAKGSLTEGGIHVPFFACGPNVLETGTSDELVHVIDLFATILDLTGTNAVAATDGIDISSKSLLPIFEGSDMEDRCIISERFGLNPSTDGRSLIIDEWPNFKLISTQDVTDPNDIPDYQMYLIGDNGVEIALLTTPPNPGDAWEEAYNALLAKDQSLQPVVSDTETIYLELLATTGPASPPPNLSIQPTSVTYLGIEVDTIEGRLDPTGTTARYWVAITLPPATTIDPNNPQAFTITFPNNANTGSSRIFDAISIASAP